MLILLSLACDQSAGLHSEADLYASIGPLFLFTFFYTYMEFSFVPVASGQMTLSAIAKFVGVGTPEYQTAAMTLRCFS